MVSYSNILVIQTAFIGDAILASSLLEKLHNRFPGAKISILVRKGNESIYEGHPFLDETLVWNKKENKIRGLFSLLFTIRKRKYDCVINCHRFASSGLLTAFSGARHKAGYKENPFSFLFDTTARHVIGDGRHEISRYNELVQDFTDKEVFKPKLYPRNEDKEMIKGLIAEPFVCFAPASVWFTKQLPVEKWVSLAKSLGNVKVYLLGSQGDTGLCEEIMRLSGNTKAEVLAGKLSLLQSCELMRHAEMNYVNDSAPLHLASSVNAPVTAFFCSTVPEFGFGPLSDNARVYGLKELPCRPCGLHGYKACPLRHFKCGHLMPMPFNENN